MATNNKAFRVKNGLELPLAGSTTTPALTVNSTNSGLYASTTDNVDVVAAGTQIANFNSTTATIRGTAVANSLKLTEDGATGGLGLILSVNSAITSADKTLTLNVNNANRQISLSGDLTVSSSATISGTNSGDQNIFSTVAIGTDTGYTWGSSNVVADATGDTLTLIPDTGIVLNSDSTLDAIRIGVRAGSTSVTGILQLTDSTSSTSTTTAATPNSVKTTYDAAVLKTGSTSTGKQTFASPAAGYASILIPNGSVDPSTPVSGDLWVNAGAMKYYNGSATKTILFSDGTAAGATQAIITAESSDTTNYLTFVNATPSGTLQSIKSNSALLYDSLNQHLQLAGKLTTNNAPLGSTTGNTIIPLVVATTTSNVDTITFKAERASPGGSNWDTAFWKIYRLVDTTSMGYMKFGDHTKQVVEFGKDSTAYMTLYAGGAVLINTATDDGVNKLQVAGNISANTGSNTAPSYTFSGRLTTGMYSPNTNTLGFTTGGTLRLNISSAGDVSIYSTTASTSTSSGALVVSGGVGIAGVMYTGGNINTTGIINTTNSTATSGTTTGALTVTGGVGIQGGIYAGGLIRFTNNTASTSTSSGALVVTGGAGIGGAIYAGGTISTTGVITTSNSTASTSTSTGALVVTGGVGIGGELYTGGLINTTGVITTTNATASSSPTTGALIVSGGAGIGGALNVELTGSFGGIVTATNVTDSSSVSSGAIVTNGGIGVAKALYVGGVFRNTDSTASTTSTTGATVITGGLGVGGAINTAGNVSTSGVITTTNATASSSTSTGAVIVTGGVGIGGAVHVGNGVTVTGAISATTTITATGDINVNGGDLVTSVTGTASLFNTNATTLNIGGAATVVNIGSSGSSVITASGTGGFIVPKGTELQRPANTTGTFRYNTDSGQFEGYTASGWGPIGGTSETFDTAATANTVAKRDASADLYANSFISSSDVRLKKNILNIGREALSIVNSLQGVLFTYKDTNENSAGFIAQDLERVLPDLVYEDERGYKAINYIGIIAYLVEAIKALDSRDK